MGEREGDGGGEGQVFYLINSSVSECSPVSPDTTSQYLLHLLSLYIAIIQGEAESVSQSVSQSVISINVCFCLFYIEAATVILVTVYQALFIFANFLSFCRKIQ